MTGHPLGRNEVEFDLAALRSFYANKRILITGAAGSIGSALALELAQLGCTHLAMLDQFDHGLIDIVEHVQRIAPKLPVTDALCDVRDSGRLDAWMRRIEPDVVFHSAALKHVHLGERHPVECVLTNLVGVRNALNAAVNAGAGHFMLISSDKAAAPSCVMGATKRLAELHLAGFQLERITPTRMKSVRFGNVIGSQGSVLPRFKAQIEAGGPLEVTHPEMERFFMTADEAVDFILNVDERLTELVAAFGVWSYGILFGIIFAETGLVVTPFLPGDSLLFAAGALAATGAFRMDLLLSATAVAAVVGNVVNYAIGRRVAHRFFDEGHEPTRLDRWVSREHVHKAHAFFLRHGGKAVVLARFVPIVRTFLPFVAGGARMPYRAFMFYNVAGCLLWVGICVIAGYLFGNIPVVKENFSIVVLGIIAVSLLPLVYEAVRSFRNREASA